MRVALVFPGISLTGFRSYGTVPESTWIHHGLCMLSACAKAAGHQVALFDMRRNTGYPDLVAQVAAYAPDAIGITAMSVDFEVAVRTARALKRRLPAPIIIGGAFMYESISILPEPSGLSVKTWVISKHPPTANAAQQNRPIRNADLITQLLSQKIPRSTAKHTGLGPSQHESRSN